MLVLSRREGGEILIGDDVRIEVVEIRRNLVRLGITAPRETPVDRPEVRRSKQQTKNRRET